MVRILRLHPSLTRSQYHIYTTLDFWDARKLLKDLAEVRRNFGKYVPGDEFPTQVSADGVSPKMIQEIEKRLRRAIPSPPRHVIARSMVFDGCFVFDPKEYYPDHWTKSRMIHFTYHRIPLGQSALSSPYRTVELSWMGEKIRIERVQRENKQEEVVKTREDARRRLLAPSCF